MPVIATVKALKIINLNLIYNYKFHNKEKRAEIGC